MRLYIEDNMRTPSNVGTALDLGCTLVNGPTEADVLMKSTGSSVVDEVFGNMFVPRGKWTVNNIDDLRKLINK